VHATSRIASAGFSALDTRRVSPGELRSPIPFHHHPMTITIPTDEALGLQIKRIIAAVAAVAVAFYVAGYTLGTAVHWLSANLTRLPVVALTTLTTTSDHADPHPFVLAAHGSHSPGARRPRQSQPQPSRGVGFA